MGNVRGNYSEYAGAADKFVPLDKSLPFLDWLPLGHDSSGEAAEKDTLGHHFLPRLPGPPRGGNAQTPAPRRKLGQLCQAQVPSQSQHRHLAQSPSSSREVQAGAMGWQQARSISHIQCQSRPWVPIASTTHNQMGLRGQRFHRAFKRP